jgi:hypothetical protein
MKINVNPMVVTPCVHRQLDILEEHTAFIFKVEEQAKQETGRG